MGVRVRAVSSIVQADEQRPELLRYHAEVYEDGSGGKVPRWVCPHDHGTAALALECGTSWLRDHGNLSPG